MEQKKVSIIIPIYNAENYLNQCLNSLKKQTYKNIEVIMINDGSKDNSEKICKSFLNDERFKLFNKKNTGVSDSRNVGIKKATGKYILFVDSDDWCDDNLIKSCVNAFENYDMICFEYFRCFIDKNVKVEINIDLNSDINKEILNSNNVGGYLWNKCFISSIIKNNNILFDKTINYCEDLLFVKQYLKYVKKVKYINEPLYYYRIRKNSVTNNFYNKNNISILKACDILIKEYKEDNLFSNSLKYSYLLNYYKLRKFIPNDFKVNKGILDCEDMILKGISKKEKIKLKFVKYFPKIFLFFKKINDKKIKAFN